MDVTLGLKRKEYGHLWHWCHVSQGSREVQEEGECSTVSRAIARSSKTKTEG